MEQQQEKMVKVIAPKGASDHVTHGARRYPLKDGTGSVPESLATRLCNSHGFTLANPGPEVFDLDPISGRRILHVKR